MMQKIASVCRNRPSFHPRYLINYRNSSLCTANCSFLGYLLKSKTNIHVENFNVIITVYRNLYRLEKDDFTGKENEYDVPKTEHFLRI